jgi:hypothetical protein
MPARSCCELQPAGQMLAEMDWQITSFGPSGECRSLSFVDARRAAAGHRDIGNEAGRQ